MFSISMMCDVDAEDVELAKNQNTVRTSQKFDENRH